MIRRGKIRGVALVTTGLLVGIVSATSSIGAIGLIGQVTQVSSCALAVIMIFAGLLQILGSKQQE